MVERSAKSAAKSKLQKISLEVDESEILEQDGNTSEDSGADSSGGESEYQAAIRKPVKRAKIDDSSSSKKASSTEISTSKKRKSLSLLPSLPLDVLFEIFGCLDPKDLINISRTNKLFRGTLWSRNATSVWKAARYGINAPDCPRDLSEPRYASLLFGNSCEICHVPNIQNVDFALRRRVCTSCKKKNLVVESRFKKLYPDEDRSVLELITFSNVGGWAQGYSSSSRFFWRSDIDDMLRKLAIHQHNIHLRVANARKYQEDFIAERKELLAEITKNVNKFQCWLSNYMDSKNEENKNVFDKRREEIIRRLKLLGYESTDISSVISKSPKRATELTERGWTQIRPKLETKIIEAKTQRLKASFESAKVIRRTIFNKLYNAYKKTISPSQWKYLPQEADIYKMEPFAQVIESAVEIRVTDAHFTDAVALLPELVSIATKTRLSQYRALLPPMTRKASTLEQGEIGEDPSPCPLGVDLLNLASSVFECPNDFHTSCGRGFYATTPSLSVIVGAEDISSHHCRWENSEAQTQTHSQHIDAQSPSSPKFSLLGSIAARLLLSIAGLDPQTASVSDIDQKDLRFTCLTCGSGTVNGRARNSYTWRNAIQHEIDYKHGNDISWTVLSSTDESTVKHKESTSLSQEKIWTCAHCPAHLNNLVQRPAVVQHVKTEHGISDPKNPDDLLVFERYRPKNSCTYGPPKMASLLTNKTIVCLMCPRTTNRLFTVNGVTDHLRAKHTITNPQSGVHYKNGTMHAIR